MKLAYYTKKRSLLSDPRVAAMLDCFREGGCTVYPVDAPSQMTADTDAVLSIGGDGTFLSASRLVGDSGIPLVGVNLGRLGFLSGNKPEDVAGPVLRGDYTVENRTRLEVRCNGRTMSALNEVSVSRISKSMLGIEVELDGRSLPAYWADGLLVSTSSGSTAYSLSAGGPICTPQSKVLIVAPVAPHNLNVRPLVVPETSHVTIRFRSRDGRVALSADDVNVVVDGKSVVEIEASARPLRILETGGSDFINALRTKLFWGEDMRNSTDDADGYND